MLGTKRRYFFGEIILEVSYAINILEIDLTDKYGLTTLVISLTQEAEEAPIEIILNSLIEKAGRWDEELINSVTDRLPTLLIRSAFLRKQKSMCTGIGRRELSMNCNSPQYLGWF